MPTRAEWARRFPILADKTYLCSHSLGAVPATTRAALDEFYDAWATKGIAAWEGTWWKAVLDFSKDMESMLGGAPGSVVPLPNATRAIAGAASCFEFGGKRNEVLMTDLEFTTFYPFWRAQERAGAKLVIVPSRDGRTVPLEDLIGKMGPRTLLVATCHAFFRSGAVQDLGAIVKAAHAAGAHVIADGYQAVGTLPVDVKRLDVDFYLGGSHKYLCGGAGAGYLYVRPDLVPDLRPKLTGWFGLEDPFAYGKDLTGSALHEGVFRFMDGTPNVPALFSAREGIRAVLAHGVENVRANSLALTRHGMKRADENGFDLRTPRSDPARSGMLCIEFPGSQAATKALVADGIIVDWRPDCGMRMSPHFYNDRTDVDRLFDALSSRAKPTKRAAVVRS